MFVWPIIIIFLVATTTIPISLSDSFHKEKHSSSSFNQQKFYPFDKNTDQPVIEILTCLNRGLFAFFIIGNIVSLLLIFYVIYDCFFHTYRNKQTIKRQTKISNNRKINVNPKMSTTTTATMTRSTSTTKSSSKQIPNIMVVANVNKVKLSQPIILKAQQQQRKTFESSQENTVKFLSHISSIATPPELKSRQQSLTI
ncbi:uncharacterized protein LOC124495500 [Dermatophagoides farinae]|uniref:Uncharacterized protein n=1 Tax=Dermatophagoides farinae TaxID=6954 RepID=A0A922LCC7_DERFA|nr:uncharacterized protein LOC124495500 [Dermatophagoides farinae]KAH7640636.1 hypothetical protein HUG17_8105 [Dermatophagoides farinae]KAH9526165.1 hypothetical protein DERF_000268 [Dermatophagoides farinae]